MAEIAEGGEGGGGKHGKKRAKKGSTRVDMTPMVDLAFLLLTFFVLTSQFSKPKVMSIVYPAKPDPSEPKPDRPPINNAYTFLLTEDQIFYYFGAFKKGETQLTETNFGPKGVRKLLSDGNAYVIQQRIKLSEKLKTGKITEDQYKEQLVKAQSHDKALKALIKTDTKATCKNFIDLIDELKINDIGMIAPVDLQRSEEELLKAKIK